jgi:hypothetical protein
MHDPGWDLKTTPLWPRFKELNAETLDLSKPVMLGRKVEGVKGITTPLQGLCLKYEGKLFLVLANPSKNEVESAIDIPTKIKKVYARGPTLVQANGNSIKLKIPGVGAELVIIEEK